MSKIVQIGEYTRAGDRFRISAYSQITTAVLAVSGLMANTEGDVQPYEHRMTITATGLQTALYPAPGGYWVMSCVVSVVSGTVNPGDVLVKVELIQGDVLTVPPYALLVIGNPDSFAPIAMGA